MIAILVGAALLTPQGSAPPTPRAAEHITAAQLFERAGKAEAAGDMASVLAFLRALTGDPDADVRAEARFRLAGVLERSGDRNAAIKAYRALLDEKPDAQRVRLELARVLALTGEEEAARRELRRAAASGLPPEVQQVVDRFATALRSRRKFGASFEFAVAPDSNINRSTNDEIIDTVIAPLTLSPDARASSGVGVTLAGQVFARPRIAETAFLVRGSVRADLYGSKKFNDISGSLAAGPELQAGRTRFRPAILAGARSYGGEAYSRSLGATLNILRPVGSRGQLEAEATVSRITSLVSADLTGTVWNGQLTYDRAFSARFSGRASTTVTRQDARDPSLAVWSGALELLLARQLGGVTAYAQVGGIRLAADERMFLFPKKRRDQQISVTGGVVFRTFAFGGFAPLVRVTQTNNASTVALYDYEKTRIEFGVSREL